MQAGPLTHVGGDPDSWGYPWMRAVYYLTGDELRELARVAGRPAPAQHVAALVAKASDRWERFLHIGMPLALLSVTLAVANLVLLLVGQPVAGLWCSAAAVLLVLGIVPVSLICRPSAQVRAIDALMDSVRSTAISRPSPGLVAKKVDQAAARFYSAYKSQPSIDRGPLQDRVDHQAAARRAATAISSQMVRLRVPEPDFAGLADDLRRIVLKVAADDWRAIDIEHNLDRSRPWLPTRGALLRHQVGGFLSQESAGKVVAVRN